MTRQFPGAFLFAAMGLLAVSPAAVSDPPAQFDVREFDCPLGGKHFTQDVGYFSLQTVQFVDGSWLGDTRIDAQVPECPGNGLLLIPDFGGEPGSQGIRYLTYSPGQLARIPELLKDSEFRKLKQKGRYERAQWLATQLGMPAKTRWELLVRSSWAAEGAQERKRLVLRIVEEGPGLIKEFDAPEMEKLKARWLVVNALREAARFDEALAELASIAESISHADGNDMQSDGSFEAVLARMRETIEARDDDRFPIGMSPSRWAEDVCRGKRMPPPYGPITSNAKAACERRQQEEDDSELAYQEESRLRKDPEQLAKLCSNTPEQERSQGLNDACESAQRDRDSAAAEDLVLHHAGEVAAGCESTPQDRRTGPLFYACIKYQLFLEGALGEQLADDDEAYKLICGDENFQPPDRAAFAHSACRTAESVRTDREVRKLMVDLKALDAYCAGTPEQDRESLHDSACFKRRMEQIFAHKERLATDPATFAAECTAPSDDMEFLCREAISMREYKKEMGEPGAPSKVERTPDVDVNHRDSGLHKVARENAAHVIAKAKADKTYPKRKRGDLY